MNPAASRTVSIPVANGTTAGVPATSSAALPATSSATFSAADQAVAAAAPQAPPGRPARITPAVSTRQVFARFWPDTRGLRGRLLLGTALVAVGVPLETVSIWLFKALVDRVLQPADFAAFPSIALSYLGLSVAMGLVSFAARQVLTRASETFVLSVRTRTFAHLQTLSMDFFDSTPLGDLLSRIGNDVSAIEALVLSGVATAISAGLRVVVFGVMLFVVDARLAVAALLASPLLWGLSRFFSGRLKQASRQSRRHVGELSSIAEENLSAIALVQAYNRQADQVDRFAAEGRRVVATALRTSRLRGLYGPLAELVELAGVMMVIGYGTWQLAHHQVSLGTLLVFVAYVSQLYSPLQGLAQLGNTWSSAAAGAERILEVLQTRPGVADRPDAVALTDPVGTVQFRDVTFTYPGRAEPALRGVSFTARPGQLVAVVGRSGSGKSTLGKLLLRFYDPTGGEVRLDGHDLRDLRLDDVRRHVAAVLQETLVVDGTIAENVLWGRPDAGPGRIGQALAAADLDTVVAQLPDGLRADVGHRGRRLSGGQRQRVAIARAMIRDAPVLLLDEPATGLDALAEQRVLAPLRRLMSGRTTILISHNLLAVSEADLILVLDRGRVVETGTHAELLALGGHYQRLYLTQQRTPLSRPVGGERIEPPAGPEWKDLPSVRHQPRAVWTGRPPKDYAPATIPIPLPPGTAGDRPGSGPPGSQPPGSGSPGSG